jgi:predicted transposase YbfD/YdcC
MLETKRTTNNQVEKSKRFCLTSLDEDMEGFRGAVRKHWGIEINLHWSLDVSFREIVPEVASATQHETWQR